jgi:hypothetical protein
VSVLQPVLEILLWKFYHFCNGSIFNYFYPKNYFICYSRSHTIFLLSCLGYLFMPLFSDYVLVFWVFHLQIAYNWVGFKIQFEILWIWAILFCPGIFIVLSDLNLFLFFVPSIYCAVSILPRFPQSTKISCFYDFFPPLIFLLLVAPLKFKFFL